MDSSRAASSSKPSDWRVFCRQDYRKIFGHDEGDRLQSNPACYLNLASLLDHGDTSSRSLSERARKEGTKNNLDIAKTRGLPFPFSSPLPSPEVSYLVPSVSPQF